jgi:hypothetical protein
MHFSDVCYQCACVLFESSSWKFPITMLHEHLSYAWYFVWLHNNMQESSRYSALHDANCLPAYFRSPRTFEVSSHQPCLTHSLRMCFTWCERVKMLHNPAICRLKGKSFDADFRFSASYSKVIFPNRIAVWNKTLRSVFCGMSPCSLRDISNVSEEAAASIIGRFDTEFEAASSSEETLHIWQNIRFHFPEVIYKVTTGWTSYSSQN